MKEKDIILAARALSVIFTPFYLPIVGLLILFFFSYMSLLPWSYKLLVLLVVYFFTILLPSVLIHIYRRRLGLQARALATKELRMVPYVISIVCYFGCYYVMNLLHIPSFMSRIVLAALLIQVVCGFVNVWWKVSTHSAAIGGVVGAIVAFSFLFDFNPLTWLCVSLILAGMVCSSRIILRQHTLSQVMGGFFIGLVLAFIAII